MTLAGSFRPGAPTIPQPEAVPSRSELDAHLQFLSAEEKATARLMGIYTDARFELETFIRTGDLTVADATFYRQLLDETNRIGSKLNTQGSEWVSSTISGAYSAGWRQNSSTVVPQEALAALSRESLGLIRETTEGIRSTIRGAIAAGILEGLPADAIRQRILASGLSNIPHWPTVEYRAGVIARTETMRAYNAGNIAAIEANMARFVEWIASPDEATCSICLPRDGKVFRLPGDAGAGVGVDPFGPAVGPLPKIPAHPRCRCTVRARYRDQNGNVIQQGAVEQIPELPPDAMGGRETPTLPPAAGDMRKALGNIEKDLESYLSGRTDRQKFWRELGPLDDDAVKFLTGTGTKSQIAKRMDAFLRLRYNITYIDKAGMTAGLRARTIRALELIRSKNAAHVVDNPYLRHIGKPPYGAKRFSRNVLARAFLSGEVEWNPGLSKQYEGVFLRIDDDGAFEVIVHEFMHSTHYQRGAYSGGLFGQVRTRLDGSGPAYDPDIAFDQNAEWRAIRQKSHGVSPAGGSLTRLEATIAQFRAAGVTTDAQAYHGPIQNVINLRRLEKQAEELRAALKSSNVDHEYWPTDYAKENEKEDFAETGTMFLLNPARLKQFSPLRYEFFARYIFP